MFALILVASIASVSALTIKNVETSPFQVMPGEEAEIRIVLENNADEDIEDVSVKLDLDEVPLAPFDSSTEQTEDEIEEDDSESFKFKVIALNDAESGIYKIPLEISYKEDGDLKTRTGLISITVNAEPELDVRAEEVVLIKGMQKEVSLKIINKGLSDVEFLEIEVMPSTYYTILSPRETYIGEIESDDFDTAEYTIHFNSDVPTGLNLPVKIEYRDITNKKYTENYNIQLTVYDAKKAVELGLIQPNTTGIYIGVVFVLVILFFVYRAIRKSRKRKKAREAAS